MAFRTARLFAQHGFSYSMAFPRSCARYSSDAVAILTSTYRWRGSQAVQCFALSSCLPSTRVWRLCIDRHRQATQNVEGKLGVGLQVHCDVFALWVPSTVFCFALSIRLHCVQVDIESCPASPSLERHVPVRKPLWCDGEWCLHGWISENIDLMPQNLKSLYCGMFAWFDIRKCENHVFVNVCLIWYQRIKDSSFGGCLRDLISENEKNTPVFVEVCLI